MRCWYWRAGRTSRYCGGAKKGYNDFVLFETTNKIILKSVIDFQTIYFFQARKKQLVTGYTALCVGYHTALIPHPISSESTAQSRQRIFHDMLTRTFPKRPQTFFPVGIRRRIQTYSISCTELHNAQNDFYPKHMMFAHTQKQQRGLTEKGLFIVF